MKKILFGTLAAATLFGAVSTASAQVRYGSDEFGYPSSAYAAPFGGWLTPSDPNSGASVGYNRNIADPDNVGGG